ncbi:hypothetical protein PR202_ga00101 [Eleusine coracana subsp. coracana]|uniref:Red chlorophyll catabolite reductase n=1 Tax=Eleusine coracana subsp. coracana TaxID=191504 RepID=A0AAV5BB07_ELECO|nr:hypothetical protein PR202_ga00101 [Eleusine coracana subsp. coracana]
MLRPDHCLRFRSPPATTCVPAPAATFSAAPTPFSRICLRLRDVRRPSRSRPALLTARASTGPDAAVARTPEMAQREVARALAAEAEARLGPRLLPSAVPADVAKFRNGAGNAVGSLDVRRGAPGSLVQFVFLTLYAPHFLMELIQGSPTSIVVILDLLPRKDLALHPDYLQKYYENTQLDKQRGKIYHLPQTRPYLSPSLFVRSAVSPTAISASIDCGQGGESVLEEIIRSQLALVAMEVLQIWLDSCADSTAEMEETERECLVKRDKTVRSKSIEVDLTANLPRMFDPDVSSKVIAEIRKAFGVQES